MYFFLIFGDNVEDVLGKWRFLALLLAADLAGNLLHILGAASSTIPCVGASGGISGIIAYYALKFPHARLGFLFRFYLLFKWVHMPAYAMFILWVGLQFVGTFMQLSGFSNVSALAHLGGAVMGLVFWVLTRKE
jgi:membrane associated rhomboid family serine protease